MEFKQQFASALKLLKEDPENKQPVAELSNSFWTWLAESLGEIIRENGDVNPFIDANVDLIDFGICPELVDTAAVKAAVADCSMETCRIQVRTVSQWLKELMQKIRSGDKVEKLERDIKVEKLQHKKLLDEIGEIQRDRRSKIENMYFRPTDPAKSLAELENTEKLQLDSIRKKKDISKGAFLTVEQKREHMKQQLELQKKLDFAAAFINTLPNKDGSTEVKNLTKRIEELFIKVVDVEAGLKKLTDELEIVQKKSSEMSTAEIETRVTEEIDYIRDLVKLSARRISIEPFPLARPEDKIFAMSMLLKSLNQITEFDPHIFHNDRVPLFGRPYVLLVPATGNAIYDWKNNCIILPTIPPGGNFMGSLATGIIEYRLDADEEKKILTSFNQLPDLKACRSIVQLKARLIKEYIIWMTSEYNGFRILSKESKNWFEHEIGPSKNDIFTPLEFQSYTMTGTEFNKLFDDITARLKEADESEGKIEPSADDLWGGALLYYQQGKPEKACPLLEKLVQVQPQNAMAWYNLGFVAMKHMNKTLARTAFNAYCKMDTQSWWSKAARDQLRNLGT